MKLNVGLLFLAAIPLAAVFSLLHVAFWLRWRDRALLWWAAANGLGVVSIILVLSYQWLPAWAARSVANTAILASSLLLWLGFRCFAGQSLPLRGFAITTVVYLASFQTLMISVNDLALMIVLASLGLGIVNAGIAFDLARASLVNSKRVRACLVTLFVLHALFYLFRSATAVTVAASAVFLHTTGLQTATMLFGLLSVLLWNAGALWLVAQRHGAPGVVEVNA